jgi:hypothetical protein
MATTAEAQALTCGRCGKIGGPRLVWQRCRNGSRHVRASCGQCNKFLGYVRQTPEVVALAEEPPPQRDLFTGLE